ncbi:MAG TPA: hypothetical protein VLA76_01705 [Candidatus Angelobacter sp.]|nr:hypothetical protein [Candidatus Angelobacter sp.]
MTIDHPVTRVVALAIALILLAMPVPVFGAKGTAITAGVGSLIDAVSPNQTAAFRATFTNGGSSTITQLNFTAAISDGAWASDLLPAGCAPPTGATVTCTIGSVPAGADTIVMDFYVTAPAVGGVTFTGTFSADAAQNNGKAQKRDTWGPYTSEEIVVVTDTELFAKWQTPHGQLRLPTEGFIGRASYQQTAVQVPAFDDQYPARVAHLADSIACDGGTTILGVGYAVDLAIAKGESPVDVTIRYTPDASERKAANQIAIVHQKDDGSCVFPARTSSSSCNFALMPNGCFQAVIEGNGNNRTLVVTMQLPSNGKVKGF